MTPDDDHHWLTYEEAAARLGIDADSVKRRAQRQGWPRRTSNNPADRRVRVAIPASAIPEMDTSPDSHPPSLETLMRDLTERAIQAEARAAAAEATVQVQAREIRRLMTWRPTKHPKVLLRRLDKLAKPHQR